ncbi:MAG: hypothetical protein Q7Q71_08000 [Verrucomicrobiota bacterium JB023]|nr:hypothetical protein [Verrucomicrobiota bacterium JB023]
MKKTIALGAISAAALTGFAYSEIESSFHVGYNSTYVWRGQDLGDSMYEYGLDFAGSCECGLDWAAGVWYANPSDGALNDELDIYGAVSKDLGYGSVELGFIHYEFDENGADNTEIYLGLGAAYAGIDLGAALYYVVDGSLGGNPLYGELSAEYGYDVSDALSVSFGLSLGSYLDGDDVVDGYTTYGARLGADYAISEDLTLSPYVAYSETDNYNAGFMGVDDFSGFFGGVSLAFSF